MAMRFTKNLANWVSLGLASSLNLGGQTKISFHTWVRYITVDNIANGNGFLTMLISSGNNSGIHMGINGSGANKVLQTRSRSVSTDATQVSIGTTHVSANVWHSVGAVFDFTGDATRLYLDGALELNDTGKVYGNTSYTPGTGQTSEDTIGGLFSVTPATTDQLDGDLAEMALWSTDLGDDGFAQLGDGFSPRLIRPAFLFEHWPMDRNFNGGIAGINGVVTGTVVRSTGTPGHPRIIRQA